MKNIKHILSIPLEVLRKLMDGTAWPASGNRATKQEGLPVPEAMLVKPDRHGRVGVGSAGTSFLI